MLKNPYDKLSYYCIHCKHWWHLYSDKLITESEMEKWLKNVSNEHYLICEKYRKSQKKKKQYRLFKERKNNDTTKEA